MPADRTDRRIRFAVALAGLAVAALVWLAAGAGRESAAFAGGLAAAAIVALAAAGLERAVRAPARRLASSLRALREAGAADAALKAEPAPLLGALPAECEALVAELGRTRRDALKATGAETAGLEAEKAGLEAVIQALSEGVVVCTPEHRVILCNAAATEMLGTPERLGLGRSLADVLEPGPLDRQLADLDGRRQADPGAAGAPSPPFACRRTDGGGSFEARLVLLPRSGPLAGYVLTLAAPPGATKRLPPRPEFYDFGLMRAHRGDAALAGRELRDLDYVVFDCEMTGLQPARGDEIVQIGAARVVRGRVLTGEGREWLVNPGRPIPPGSIRFHGVTDADVADAPRIAEVLPAFRAFVGDAVMVAHNAAFDLRFIALKEHEAGVVFDNPVLDTMLLSVALDGSDGDHSLDGLCARYGIAPAGRHTALGDAFATAELLVRLIDRLEANGMTTLGEVMRRSDMAGELRRRATVVDPRPGAAP